MKTRKHKQGFSLIESVIYLALFGLIISSALFSSYGIIESGNKNSDFAKIQNEALFINKKINWALTDAESVSVSNDGKILTMSKPVSNTDNPIVIRSTNDYIDISTNFQSPYSLTNERYKVTQVNFTYDPTLKSVEVEYSIDGKKFKHSKYINI